MMLQKILANEIYPLLPLLKKKKIQGYTLELSPEYFIWLQNAYVFFYFIILPYGILLCRGQQTNVDHLVKLRATACLVCLICFHGLWLLKLNLCGFWLVQVEEAEPKWCRCSTASSSAQTCLSGSLSGSPFSIFSEVTCARWEAGDASFLPTFLSAQAEFSVWTLLWEFLEKEMASHSSILAQRIRGQRSQVGCCPQGRTVGRG